MVGIEPATRAATRVSTAGSSDGEHNQHKAGRGELARWRGRVRVASGEREVWPAAAMASTAGKADRSAREVWPTAATASTAGTRPAAATASSRGGGASAGGQGRA